ncbi:DNA (cytosine-5)-methyltransferase CMT1, partial [Linum perenne]
LIKQSPSIFVVLSISFCFRHSDFHCSPLSHSETMAGKRKSGKLSAPSYPARKSARKEEKNSSSVLTPQPSSQEEEIESVSAVNPSSGSTKRSRDTTISRSATASPATIDADLEVPVADESAKQKKSKAKYPTKTKKISDGDESEAIFLGNPVPDVEACERWPHRYVKKGQKSGSSFPMIYSNESDEELIEARCHYSRAKVDGIEYKLNDNAHVEAEPGNDSYICKIVEMFEAVDGTPHFTAQWYYRARDTIIEDGHSINEKRVFFSEVKDDNPLDCLVGKINIAMLRLQMVREISDIPICDYYCEAMYLLPYSTFIKLPSDMTEGSESSSTISQSCEDSQPKGGSEPYTLLDLYSGCGGMSTGLCLGSKLSGQELVTKWAVDLNKYACESLKLNHPDTEVRNETVDDFLKLIVEWEKLCIRFSLISSSDPEKKQSYLFDAEEEEDDDSDENDADDPVDDSEIFEVEKVLSICYGKPDDKDHDLYFKVKWKGYGPEYDSWEPISGLGNCLKVIREFVTDGFNRKILPVPGSADVICGGPPCQGISGFNRFRNKEKPLEDEKNRQLTVYMDVINFLKPKFVLMENVVDILKFANGFLGRHAVGRLIDMNYQTRIGILAAGTFGLPQFRLRVFLWGALPTEDLPPYPLPTHDALARGGIPNKFENCLVAFDEGATVDLKNKLLLGDALSDLPPVENDEQRDEMPYKMEPQTEFQRMIRYRNSEAVDLSAPSLNSHRPLQLNPDDYERVCQIPKRKGANFRDLPGVIVRPDNKVEFDPNVERHLVKSKKPLVPDYAMSFMDGASTKPFGRLWWDETVPTVVTRAEPHNQVILHPLQDRVLTVRENARLQGFPDHYKLVGPIKERYIQIGNAVAVPVARALGFVLGKALTHNVERDPLFTLPMC